MEIVTRKEAQERELVRYFTGRPCKHGHIAERLTVGRYCNQCNIERSGKYAKTPAGKELAKRYYRGPKGQARVQREIERNALDPNFPARRRRNLWKHLGYPEPTRPEPLTCEICDNPPSGRTKALALDHDHKTGKFRGWLCSSCNQGLGRFKDNPELLTRAATYLTVDS